MSPSATLAVVTSAALAVLASSAPSAHAQAPADPPATSRPNVLIILTDDQGYGDIGAHGHPFLKTPNLDRLHKQSVRLGDFHVAPMCTPTRGQLLTGMDALRNGAVATCLGQSMMREGVPTAADIFSANGYATGIFGKWHLGYNYPHRPADRGFQKVINHYGYGISGMGDVWKNDYQDPFYFDGDQKKQASGYCTDVWFDEAMSWMQQCTREKKPFFCYLPTNAPHFPMWVDPKYAAPYQGKSFDAGYYGMVANLDENIGRLESFLAAAGIRDNTIVIFMTDNGPAGSQKDYTAGMRGGKVSLYEGGHRVPCFIRWPGGALPHDSTIDTTTQVQDILPTLVDFCSLADTRNAHFDGVSLASLLKEGKPLDDRMLVVQFSHSGITKGNAAVLWNNWRMIDGRQLFDLRSDLAQEKDVFAEHPEVVQKMQAHYDQWWQSVEPVTRQINYNHIGSPQQAVVELNSSDWFGVRADGQNSALQATARQGNQQKPDGGPWMLHVAREGTYEVELRRWPREEDAALTAGVPEHKVAFGEYPAGKALPITRVTLRIGDQHHEIATEPGAHAATFTVQLKPGPQEMHAWFSGADTEPLCGAYFAYVKLQ